MISNVLPSITAHVTGGVNILLLPPQSHLTPIFAEWNGPLYLLVFSCSYLEGGQINVLGWKAMYSIRQKNVHYTLILIHNAHDAITLVTSLYWLTTKKVVSECCNLLMTLSITHQVHKVLVSDWPFLTSAMFLNATFLTAKLHIEC